jgi:hypothetical protein
VTFALGVDGTERFRLAVTFGVDAIVTV